MDRIEQAVCARGPLSPKQRLIVALDVPDRASALDLVERLSETAGMFKIGSQLFTAEGPGLVREIAASGAGVFLDLKFHDIPNTVAEAVGSAARLGVSLLNVHALGGSRMMRAAADSVRESSKDGESKLAQPPGHLSLSRPAVLGVTILTSMDEASLGEVGIAPGLESQVARLALLARDAGLDGVVASPLEVSVIRERVAADRFIIVAPGVRPAWFDSGDQKRVSTPSEAVRAGADFIVIGRPITASRDPRAASLRILEEMSRDLA